MTSDSPTKHTDEPRLPTALEADLRDLYAPPPADARGADRLVRSIAARHLAHRRRVRRIRFAGAVAGAGLAAALVLSAAWFLRGAPGPGAANRVALRDDFDPAGQVTVLDAYALARSLRERESISPRYDVNSDGTIDAHDVDAIAMASVRLNRGASP